MRLPEQVQDARERTLALHADLSDEQMLGPRLPIVNPPLWEIGHVAWFQEWWVLRHHAGREPMIAGVDALYDSARIPHATRWDLPLLPRARTLRYLADVRDAVLDRLDRQPDDEQLLYFVRLSVFHEDMHDEAFTYTRQTHGWPAPPVAGRSRPATTGSTAGGGTAGGGTASRASGDVLIRGGAMRLGAEPGAEPFVFDNEKWAHDVELGPFRMARTKVTDGEFAAFVADGGYARRELWSDAGWQWREAGGVALPNYWRSTGASRFERRHFDRWRPLVDDDAVVLVSWFEADAYCRWAGRRLPTEAEWEAAAGLAQADGSLGTRQRRFPWGDEPAAAARANLGHRVPGTVSVHAHAAGDTPAGIRQMTGSAWEWTADWFAPYPGFVPDPYAEYSQPWFGDHKVLRGGAWATQGRLLRTTWRNFYRPERRDVFAGFRTCALEP